MIVRKILVSILVFALVATGCARRESGHVILLEPAEEPPALVDGISEPISIDGVALEQEPPQPEQHEVEQPPLSTIPPATPPIRQFTGEVGMIALTFDDGPSQQTARILDTLEQHGGRATFFVLGSRVEGYAGIARRAVSLGSEIVGHSWTHSDFSLISPEELAWEIGQTSDTIERITGRRPNFYRPPYGRTNSSVRALSFNLGYAMVNWTLDTRDWEIRDAEHIYETIITRVSGGDIVLMHDIYTSTADAMELVIPRLISEGFELVTVSELLAHLYGTLEPGRIYGNPNETPSPHLRQPTTEQPVHPPTSELQPFEEPEWEGEDTSPLTDEDTTVYPGAGESLVIEEAVPAPYGTPFVAG